MDTPCLAGGSGFLKSRPVFFFFQSVLCWSVAVSTICRHSSQVVAFLQAVARPKFRRPRSASIARSQVSLGLPAGRFQSGGTCRIHAARALVSVPGVAYLVIVKVSKFRSLNEATAQRTVNNSTQLQYPAEMSSTELHVCFPLNQSIFNHRQPLTTFNKQLLSSIVGYCRRLNAQWKTNSTQLNCFHQTKLLPHRYADWQNIRLKA